MLRQSHRVASHILFFFSIWHLNIFGGVPLSAVPGGCRERWGWLVSGGLLLDTPDGRVDPVTSLGGCSNLVAVARESQ